MSLTKPSLLILIVLCQPFYYNAECDTHRVLLSFQSEPAQLSDLVNATSKM